MLGTKLGLGITFRAGAVVQYEAEASALFARFTTPPTSARKALINSLISSLKTAGVWAKLDALYLMAAADAQAARRNWIADTFNLSAVSAPTFTADRGYQGDGAAAYLDTGFTPSTAPTPKFALNSASLAVWSKTDVTNSAAYDIGGVNGKLNARSANANTCRGSLNDATLGNFGANADSLGHFVLTRTASNVRAAYRNGVSLGTDAIASTAVPSVVLKVLAADGSNFSTRQLAAASIGGGLTAQNVIDLYNATNTFLTAIGA